jgi:hypothetical protein
VREKADVVWSEPRENEGKAFMAALRDDWRPSVTSQEIKAERERDRRRQEQRQQEEARRRADEEAQKAREKAENEAFDCAKPGLAARWHQASPEQRKAWLEDFPFKGWIPKEDQEPSGMFLGILWPKLDPEGHAAHRRAFPPPREAAA